MKVIVHLNAREEQARGFARKSSLFLLVLGFISVVGVTFTPLFATAGTSAPGSASSPSSVAPALAGNSPAGAFRPRSIPGQKDVDANTVSLYHFDNPGDTAAIDAAGNYTGTMQGNARVVTPGLYVGNLQLDTSSSVRTRNLGAMSSGTIEAFVDFGQGACAQMGNQFPIFSAFDANNNPIMVVGQYWDGWYNTLQFSAWTPAGWFTSNTNINSCRYLNAPAWTLWPYETWRFHHVAITWGRRGVEMWVDGVLHALGVNSDLVYGQETCNPQQQMFAVPYVPPTPYPWGPTPGPWPHYPLCPAPAFSQTPVWGTYTGGLGPFSTLQLGGCYPGMGCYDGRLDEVRISDVQRTYDWRTTDPTSTPPPTLTPLPFTGEYSVDPFTLRLYHMNYKAALNTVYDEVSHQSYRAGLNTNITEGRFINSIAYSNASSPTIMDNPGNPSNGTIEGWVNLSNVTTSFNIFSSRIFSGTNVESMILGVDLNTSPNLRFGISDGTWMHWVDSGIQASRLTGTWHHVAGTWGETGLQIWIDGERCSTDAYTGKIADPLEAYFAGCGPLGKCMNGAADEVRISNIARTFTPDGLNVQSKARYGPRAPDTGTLSFLPYLVLAPTPSSIIHCGGVQSF